MHINRNKLIRIWTNEPIGDITHIIRCPIRCQHYDTQVFLWQWSTALGHKNHFFSHASSQLRKNQCRICTSTDPFSYVKKWVFFLLKLSRFFISNKIRLTDLYHRCDSTEHWTYFSGPWFLQIEFICFSIYKKWSNEPTSTCPGPHQWKGLTSSRQSLLHRKSAQVGHVVCYRDCHQEAHSWHHLTCSKKNNSMHFMCMERNTYNQTEKVTTCDIGQT